MECFCNSLNITSVETSNGNSTILSHVNVVFFSENVHLIHVKTSVGKHTDLGGDVTPVKGAAFTG